MRVRPILLKLFLVCSLFFPAFYSPFQEDYKMEYYASFTVAYAFLVLYMAAWALKGRKRTGQSFVLVCSGFLLVYNILSLYMNIRYLHWYGEQINNTVAFLFFFCLCFYEDSLGTEKDGMIRFFLWCIILSNAAAILYYFAGYTSFLICNHHFYFIKLPEDYYESRFYWLYSHKSDYALMLTAFLAVCIRFRAWFKSRVLWLLGMAVLLFALFLSHSWTGFGAAAILFLGAALDQVDWKKFHLGKKQCFVLVLLGVCGVLLGKALLAERDLLSFGGRPEIWAGALRTIRENPEGWGYQFGEVLFEVRPGWSTNNAHNVFLNALLRFSVPVGICFTVLFLLLAGWCIYKSRSFLAAGMWIALLLLMNMDYSLLNYEMGMLFFAVYLVCIYQSYTKEEPVNGMVKTTEG